MKNDLLIRRISHASDTGHVDDLERILDDNPNQYVFQSALTAAISKGNTEKVKWLLSRGADHYDLIEASIKAAQEGYFDMVMLLLSHNKRPDDTGMGRILITALQSAAHHITTPQQIGLIQHLLSHTISYDHLIQGLQIAVENKMVACVMSILQYYPEIDKRDALMLAIQTNCIETILLLSSQSQGLHLIGHIYFGDIKRAENLLTAQRADTKTLWTSLIIATKLNAPTFVSLLLKHIRLTEAVDEALLIAVELDYNEIIQILLANNPSKKTIRSAVIYAIFNHRTRPLKTICTHVNTLETRLLQAVYLEDFSQIKKLFDHALPKETLEAALEIAVFKGSTDIVYSLLDTVEHFNPIKIGEILRDSLQYGNISIIRMLLKADTKQADLELVLQEMAQKGFISSLLIDCTKYNDIQIIEMILRNNFIPSVDTLQSMIVQSTKAGHAKLIKELIPSFVMQHTLLDATPIAQTIIQSALTANHVYPSIDGILSAFDIALQHYKQSEYPLERMRYREIMRHLVESIEPENENHASLSGMYDSAG